MVTKCRSGVTKWRTGPNVMMRNIIDTTLQTCCLDSWRVDDAVVVKRCFLSFIELPGHHQHLRVSVAQVIGAVSSSSEKHASIIPVVKLLKKVALQMRMIKPSGIMVEQMIMTIVVHCNMFALNLVVSPFNQIKN